MTAGQDAVRLSRVTRLFDGLAAVSNVSLEIARGETVWLRGWNGSGKTTLLRLVATAISPTFGGGTVLGFDLQAGRAAIRARSDLLSHDTRLYADLTAAENLRFACRLYGLDPRRAEPALEQVGLQDVAAVRTASFSQGMRQRLALARCLMRAPALILLDEPYAGLDSEARIVVDDLLTVARATGQTVIVASHEAPPAHLVDRAVTMDGGRLAAPPLSTPAAFEVGRARQARTMVDRALATNPKYPEGLYVRGLIDLMGLRQPATAVRDLNAYLTAAPYGSHRTDAVTLIALAQAQGHP